MKKKISAWCVVNNWIPFGHSASGCSIILKCESNKANSKTLIYLPLQILINIVDNLDDMIAALSSLT